MSLHPDLYDWYPGKHGKKGVIVVCHGVSEHRGRYRQWAEWMAHRGWSILVPDLPGHGRIAATPGYCEATHWHDFKKRLMDAAETADRKCPHSNLWIIGHSMGSFITMTSVGDQAWPVAIRGMVLLGTDMPGRLEALLIGGVAAIGSAIDNDRNRSRLLEYLVFARYQRKLSRRPPGFDWISNLWSCREDYRTDPLCGRSPSRRMWQTLGQGLNELSRFAWSQRLPESLDILVMAGGNDPVGRFARGPKRLTTKLRSSGHACTLKVYPTARHELLQNGSDVAAWFDLERMVSDLTRMR